jgi:hypothetical protein
MITKRNGSKAFDLLAQWKKDGVPDFVTASEAYNLSSGKVGVPFNNVNRNIEFRLIDVAVKTITKAGN